MNPFLRKILDASRLTRQGKLGEATALIQRALAPSTESSTRAAGPSPVTTAEVVEAEDIGAEVVEVAENGDEAVLGSTDDTAALAEVEDDDEVAVVEPVTTTVDEVRPARRPSSDTGRFLDSSFTGADGTRTFKLFVPAGFDGEALPLVVMLHGCTQNPDDFAAGTGMNELAQEQGFLVLYPAQAPRSNAHKCWNWFSPGDQRRGAGEPALLAGMTRHVLQTHSVDHDRVYVAGLSAGGAMAAILAREYPDVFAAAGVHSGVAPGAAHDVQSAFMVMKSGPGGANDLASALLATMSPLRPAAAEPPSPPAPGAPVIVFHGDADKTVVAANGDTVVAAALGDAGVVASIHKGATGARSYRRTVWRLEGDDAESPSLAEHWVVHGGGHAWSGGSAAGSFTDPDGPAATREMLRFFAEHPRRTDSPVQVDQTNV